MAVERSGQCVAFGGIVSSVSRIVSAISSSPICRGAPHPSASVVQSDDPMLGKAAALATTTGIRLPFG